MWVEILCGLVICILVCVFFNDDTLDIESLEADAIFTVVNRLEKLYNGMVYVGLRIPDADSGSRQNIDMVLVTKGEVAVVSFKNLAGFLTIKPDGGWLCKSDKQRGVHHPDPVVEAKRQAIVLQGYLEQRGVALPEGYISCKVIIPNHEFCILNADYLPSEVIPYNEWAHVKSEAKSSWFKGAVCTGKKEVQESMQHQLDFALSTAPVWDRLELKGVRFLLGEFLEFKGKHDDIQALQHIKRSKVGQIAVKNMSIFGVALSRVEVLSSERDYRKGGASGAEWRKVTVSSSTELVFQPRNSKKLGKIKLSSVTSVVLSA